jgi:hypothetical protein
MPLDLILCFGTFFLIVIALIVYVSVRGGRDRLSGFSPEQQRALRVQNNALTLWAAAFLIGGCILLPIMEKIPPILMAFLRNGCFTFGIALALVIAFSSIVSRVNIFSPGRARLFWRHNDDEFSKDADAVNTGILILLVVAVILLARFGK